MRTVLIALAILSAPAMAEVVIPELHGANNFDRITTAGGTTCRQGHGSNVTLDTGVIYDDSGSVYDPFDPDEAYYSQSKGGAIYARVVYHIGAPKQLDCSRLYNSELQRLQAENAMLRERYAVEH